MRTAAAHWYGACSVSRGPLTPKVRVLGETFMNRVHLLVILLLAVVAVPFAAADTIQLTFNGTNIATVSLTAVSGGVKVSITADPGYSIKTEGGDILFNTGGVTINPSSISNLTVDGFMPAYKFDTNQTRAGVTFAY